jgi:hypothetical protein
MAICAIFDKANLAEISSRNGRERQRGQTRATGEAREMTMLEWAAVAGGLALLGGLVLWFFYRGGTRRREQQARAQFPRWRETLRTQFFTAAAASGKPKGLRWKECQWEDWVEFARHRKTGDLVALECVTLHFEAIPGGDMEDVPAVGLPRNATAVFFFNRGYWHTLGKVVFNKNPDEAAEHFRSEYERLGGARSEERESKIEDRG